MQKWLQRIVRPARVAGLSLQVEADQSLRVDMVLLRYQAGKLEVEAISSTPGSWEATLAQLPADIPVALAVDGKGVLTKRCPPVSGALPEFVAQVLPDIQATAFAFQLMSLPRESVLALARQELLNHFVRQAEAAGHRVLHLDLAFLGLETLLPALPDPVEMPFWLVQHAEGRLTSFQAGSGSDSRTFSIGDQQVPARHLTAFAAAMAPYAGAANGVSQLPAVQASQRNYQLERYFQVGGIAFLGFLFLALCLNTLLFFQLDKQLQAQNLSLAAHREQLALLDTLKNKYREKQVFLDQNSLASPSITSWYADQIGASVPPGIQLKALRIFPEDSRRKGAKAEGPRFVPGLIQVKGISQRSPDLNQWIKVLNSMSWVQEVTVLPYAETSDGQGEFELEVLVKKQ